VCDCVSIADEVMVVSSHCRVGVVVTGGIPLLALAGVVVGSLLS